MAQLQSIRNAPVAQMDRACASGAQGRGFEPLRARHFLAVRFTGTVLVQWTPANGFSMRMPAILWPAFRSSDRIRVAPFFSADETIRASQKPIRDSSSIRNAEAISVGVVPVHQIAELLTTRRAQ